MSDVSAMTQQRTGASVNRTSDAASAATVATLLSRPLTADSTVQIALANNKALQASFNELGIAEADYVQSGRLPNPGFMFGRYRNGADSEIDRSILFNFASLLTLPVRHNIERGRFEQAKLRAVLAAVTLAGDSRRAFYIAVAAQQTAGFMSQVKDSAEAGAQLAQRMAKIGNFSALDYERQQVFYAESMAQFARATLTAASAREALLRLLGMSVNTEALLLPDRLPDLPKSLNPVADLESQAMTQRLDIQLAKRDTEATASALGMTKASRFVNVLDAGYQNRSDTGKTLANGYIVTLELPIFDWSSVRIKGAEGRYQSALNRTADTAVRARSEVRQAALVWHTQYDLARHYRDEIVPLRKKIADEIILRYNGMLTGVFELLADAREQAVSVNGAIEAQRDFWIADTNLQASVSGTGGAWPETSGVRIGEMKY